MEALKISQWLGDKATLAKCEEDLKACGGKVSGGEVFEYQNWCYLVRRGIVLVDEPSKIVEVEPYSLSGKFLSVLGSSASVSVSDLFEKVWELRFNKARHNNILRVTITNLRKQILPTAIQVINGDVSLK